MVHLDVSGVHSLQNACSISNLRFTTHGCSTAQLFGVSLCLVYLMFFGGYSVSPHGVRLSMAIQNHNVVLSIGATLR